MKTLVEHCKKLSIYDLTRRAKAQLFEALLRADISLTEQDIKLTTSNCYFGGKRFWLVCPGCNRRVGVLYQKPYGELLRCRKCYSLSYLKTRYHKMI